MIYCESQNFNTVNEFTFLTTLLYGTMCLQVKQEIKKVQDLIVSIMN